MTDIAVTDNCKNPDSYGEICVKCNKCGRFGEQEITRTEAIEVLKVVDENASCDDCLYYAQMEDCPTNDDCIIRKAIWLAISYLECGKMLEVCYDQVKQERDIAIGQLKELGYELGQKIEPITTSTDEPMTMVYPTIFCDDAISRKDAISAISTDYVTAVRNLESLPSVQPSRKGHWIEHEKVYECSECQIIRAKGMTGKYNYCPSCGACMKDGRTLDEFIEDMRGEE